MAQHALSEPEEFGAIRETANYAGRFAATRQAPITPIHEIKDRDSLVPFCLSPAGGLRNELSHEDIRHWPDRFVALKNPVHQRRIRFDQGLGIYVRVQHGRNDD